MSPSRGLPALLALFLGGGAPAISAPVPHAVSIVGSAEVKLTGVASQGSVRIVFAASADPELLRLEVVRAGSVAAVVYCDAERLRVLVPGAQPLLHEGKPTREGFESALGLPFCLGELLFALRAGNAAAPACEGRSAVAVRSRGGQVSGLEREGQRGGRPELLRFSRWRESSSGPWPTRAVLEAEGSLATLLFGALRPHDTQPLDLEPRLAEAARRVDAAELRRVLGLEEASP